MHLLSLQWLLGPGSWVQETQMESAPTEPARKRARISKKTEDSLVSGLCRVAHQHTIESVNKYLEDHPKLVPQVAAMVGTDMLSQQPAAAPLGNDMIPQPCSTYGKIPQFRVDILLTLMEPELFSPTIIQQLGAHTKRNLLHFALDVKDKDRFSRPDPAAWDTLQNNLKGQYSIKGKRMSSATCMHHDGTVHVHPDFMKENGGINWAAAVGHFILTTGHPETVEATLCFCQCLCRLSSPHTHTHCQELMEILICSSASGSQLEMTTSSPWSRVPKFKWQRLSQDSGRSTATGTSRKPRQYWVRWP